MSIGGYCINIIVHYPTDEKNITELKKMIARENAQMTIKYIKDLDCTEDKKIQILDNLIHNYKSGS